MINHITLSQRRTSLGLSQRKFALMVGLNYQAIRRLEAGGDDGNLRLRDLDKICTVLGIRPTELLRNTLVAATRDTRRGADAAAPQCAELDLSQARLLRRIQAGIDTRRVLSQAERELVLPSLIRLRLVVVSTGGTLMLSSTATEDL